MRHTTRRAIRAAQATGHALAAAARGRTQLLRYTLTTAAIIVIDYVKEDGEKTTRRIAPDQIRRSKAGDYYVRAHDYLRDAARSFRLDRIAAYRPETS